MTEGILQSAVFLVCWIDAVVVVLVVWVSGENRASQLDPSVAIGRLIV